MMRLATVWRWWGALVVVLAAIAVVLGFEAWERPARRASQAVRRALAAGRYADARVAVERWLQLRPRSAEAQYYRAKVAIADGRSHDIYEGLKEAEARGCAPERMALLHALLDAQHGRVAQAKPVLVQAFAALSEPDPMLDEALARVFIDTYDFAHAGPVLDRWARDAPNDPRPPLWHAKVHLRRNAEPDVVLADYREALRRAPNTFEARLGKAEQLERAQRDREAADAYNAALALGPDNAAAHLGAGRNALALGDDSGASLHLARALELDPESAAAHLEQAKLDLRRGDASAALSHLDRAIARVPADAATHYQRSLALKRLARNDEASREQETFTRLQRERRQLDDLQEELNESPDDTSLQARVARWMFDHSYDDEALSWCRKILIDSPRHAETCLLLAAYYDRRGDGQKAEAYRRLATERAARIEPPR